MLATGRRPLLVAATLLIAAIAACTPTPAATPVPSPGATPTPVTVVVRSALDAATLVIASDPLFSGAAPQADDVIGQSKYWVATPLDGGGYRIDLTIGWGDCMAGCIDRHVWTYEVSPDGTLELVSEDGPEVPPDVR